MRLPYLLACIKKGVFRAVNCNCWAEQDDKWGEWCVWLANLDRYWRVELIRPLDLAVVHVDRRTESVFFGNLAQPELGVRIDHCNCWAEDDKVLSCISRWCWRQDKGTHTASQAWQKSSSSQRWLFETTTLINNSTSLPPSFRHALAKHLFVFTKLLETGQSCVCPAINRPEVTASRTHDNVKQLTYVHATL